MRCNPQFMIRKDQHVHMVGYDLGRIGFTDAFVANRHVIMFPSIPKKENRSITMNDEVR